MLALALLMTAAFALLSSRTAWAAAVPPPGAAAATPVWDWPVDAPHTLARAYRAPPTPYGAGHRGIDVVAAVGTPVRSPDEGVISFAGVVGDRPVLSIRHSGGIVSSFEPVDAAVAEGRAVKRGEVVGTVAGSAGHCAGDCLHVGARLDGRYFSPLVLLGGVPRAVLLPLVPSGADPGQARG